MYNIIKEFINHDWISTTNQGDQAYIYAISCILCVVFVVTFINLIRDVFSRFFK